jgi:hypothetical protein
LDANLEHNPHTAATTLESKKLRPEIIQRVKAMDDESLLLLHRVLLRLEKERLWRELSAEAEADRRAGKFVNDWPSQNKSSAIARIHK